MEDIQEEESYRKRKRTSKLLRIGIPACLGLNSGIVGYGIAIGDPIAIGLGLAGMGFATWGLYNSFQTRYLEGKIDQLKEIKTLND